MVASTFGTIDGFTDYVKSGGGQNLKSGYNSRSEFGEDTIKTRRILMIAPTSFFADYGCHVRILEEIRGLSERGHTVELCTYHNGRDLDGIQIRRTVDIPWRRRAIVGSSKHKIYLDIALAITVLRRTRSFRPDVIHAHLHEGALIGSVAGILFRRPVIFDYQGSLTEEMIDHGFLPATGVRTRFVRWMERHIDGLPTLIIPSSNAASCHLRTTGADMSRVRVISDAVPLDRFDPAANVDDAREWRDRLGIPPTAQVVIYLGLLADYQGTPTLIRAADRLLGRNPGAYVVIAGYPGVGRHARMAEDLENSSRILFPGRIPYHESPGLLAAADVAVAPKRSVTEANGKVLNYMAMNLPTVCTDTPVNRDLLGDMGWFVPPDDHEAMARALEEALQATSTPDSRLRERVAGRFSRDRQIQEIEELYERALGDSADEILQKRDRPVEPLLSDD